MIQFQKIIGSTNVFNDKIALKAFNNRHEEVVEEKNKVLPQFDIEA